MSCFCDFCRSGANSADPSNAIIFVSAELDIEIYGNFESEAIGFTQCDKIHSAASFRWL